MAVTPPRLPWRVRMKLMWGKARRFGLGLFRLGYVRRSAARREGRCLRCGACCRLAYRCQFLREKGNCTECRVHWLRPRNCRLFPIDERDLADRDAIAPDVPCGYRFNEED